MIDHQLNTLVQYFYILFNLNQNRKTDALEILKFIYIWILIIS